jgi:hypothetical protein
VSPPAIGLQLPTALPPAQYPPSSPTHVPFESEYDPELQLVHDEAPAAVVVAFAPRAMVRELRPAASVSVPYTPEKGQGTSCALPPGKGRLFGDACFGGEGIEPVERGDQRGSRKRKNEDVERAG